MNAEKLLCELHGHELYASRKGLSLEVEGNLLYSHLALHKYSCV